MYDTIPTLITEEKEIIAMIIRHRGIYRDRFDNPTGLGMLVAAIDCYGSCKGCFHQDMREKTEIHESDADELLDNLQSDIFHNTLILGFFEWLDYQYDECIYLIEGALNRNLNVILYTRRDEDVLRIEYPRLFDYKGLYIKCGAYDETKLSSTYTSYGVPLASTNQKIIKVE